MKVFRWLSLIAGVLLIICSFFMYLNPIKNLVGFAFFISISMLCAGLSEILKYFSLEKGHRSGWLIMSGILSILLGAWLLSGGGKTVDMAVILPFVFAMWVLCSGVIRAIGAFSLKSQRESSWGFVLFLGIIGIILGFILLYHPLFSGIILSCLIASIFLYQGISCIANFFILRGAEY